MLSFLLGLVIGGIIGVLFMALFQFSKKCEEYDEEASDDFN